MINEIKLRIFKVTWFMFSFTIHSFLGFLICTALGSIQETILGKIVLGMMVAGIFFILEILCDLLTSYIIDGELENLRIISCFWFLPELLQEIKQNKKARLDKELYEAEKILHKEGIY